MADIQKTIFKNVSGDSIIIIPNISGKEGNILSVSGDFLNWAAVNDKMSGYVNKEQTDCSIGNNNSAENNSFSQGSSNSSINNSIAIGRDNAAKSKSVSIGSANSAEDSSLSVGFENISNENSLALGNMNSAINISFAQGQQNYSNFVSFSFGDGNSANNYSQTFGKYLRADNHCMAIGSYNNTTSGAFVIGNGDVDSNTRSDAFIVYHDGSVSAAGKISANGVELGGGGGSQSLYTRTTAGFGEQQTVPSPISPEFNVLKQEINISNNTYTIATGFIPDSYEDVVEGETITGSEILSINMNCDFPMAIVRLEKSATSGWIPQDYLFDGYNMHWIKVKNNNIELTRLYPLPIDKDFAVDACLASYSEWNYRQADVIEIHILGDSFNIQTSVGVTSGISA